jgi:ferredoxin
MVEKVVKDRKRYLMEMIVNPASCKGCGICVGACPYSAITMQDRVAVIDQAKCTACRACLEACPTGALQLVETAEYVAIEPSPAFEVLEPETIVVKPERTYPAGLRLLSLIGQYLVPRMVDVLANYLDKSISAPARTQHTPTHQVGADYPCRRRRQRRGRANMFNTYERS